MYPRSGFRSGGTCERTLVPVFRSGGTCERTLVPVFAPGEHPPRPPFWKPPFWAPAKLARFQFLRCKNYVAVSALNSPRATIKSETNTPRNLTQRLFLPRSAPLQNSLCLHFPTFQRENTARTQRISGAEGP